MKTLIIASLTAVLVLLSGCKGTGEQSSTAKSAKKSLTLTAPASVTIARGGTADIKVTLDRKNFTDKVTVKFENIPKGVHAVNAAGLNVDAGPVKIDLGHEAPPIAGDGTSTRCVPTTMPR